MRLPTWALSVALAGLLLAWAAAGRAEDAKVEEGKPAPDFELPATQIDKVLPDKKDAKTLSLKDLRGKNVVTFLTITGGRDIMPSEGGHSHGAARTGLLVHPL
jgi:hypothetical protein